MGSIESNSKRRSGGRVFLEGAVDALCSLFERNGRSKGLERLPGGARREPASGEHLGYARRLTSTGGKGSRAPREYTAGFGWHTVFLYIALPVVLALIVAPKQLLEQIPGVPRMNAAVAGGDVIVVSARESHRDAVISTAQPRGYSVTAVGSASAFRSAIANSANLRFVVIDRDSAATAALRAAVQEKSPAARIILLPESATTLEVGNLLIQAGLR